MKVSRWAIGRCQIELKPNCFQLEDLFHGPSRFCVTSPCIIHGYGAVANFGPVKEASRSNDSGKNRSVDTVASRSLPVKNQNIAT